MFYALHDQLGWPRALFMSVNVGWSIGWSMEGLSEFKSPWSQLFTIYHTSIGVLFAGITVLFIAEEVGKDKDNWIMQVIKVKEFDAASRTEGCWDSFVSMVQVHLPTLRIIFAFLVWFSFGLLWYPFTNPDFSMSKNVDWLMSTLTTGGYLTIPSTASGFQLVVTALYTNVGVPLMSIALGMVCQTLPVILFSFQCHVTFGIIVSLIVYLISLRLFCDRVIDEPDYESSGGQHIV